MTAVIADLPRIDRNIHQFHRAAAANGVRVRAHLKAHRTVELARRQVAAGAVGAAVQTAQAARRLAQAGIADVVVAWPWSQPWRYVRYAEAATVVPRLAVHVSDAEAVAGIGAAAERRGTRVGVRIDLRHTPEETVPALAERIVTTPGVWMDGVTGYSAPATLPDIRDRDGFGRRHAHRVVEAAAAVRHAGVECPVVSVGGTPTADGAGGVAGVTEICAGAYATYDGGLAAVGACAPAQVAVSVAEDASDLLGDCAQPWAPEEPWRLAPAPYEGRLVPAHICPLAVTLVRRGLPIMVIENGGEVGTWRPFAAPDRE